MSAAVAGIPAAAAVAAKEHHLIHYSSRPIETWGKIPKKSEYNDSLAMGMTRVTARTGKPFGLWYAYDEEWIHHYKPAVLKNMLRSEENKENAFAYKYAFTIPDSVFTTDIREDPTKVLVLNSTNFVPFLIKYFAPGLGTSKYRTWRDFWHGYEIKGRYNSGVKDAFLGVDFQEDLVELGRLGKSDPSKLTMAIEYKGEMKNVDVGFLKFLEIRSGVLFHPERILDSPPSKYLVAAREGGRRKSRRLLRSIPRRLAATRRTRSRV